MQAIIHRIFDNNLEDFRGIRINGTIALSEALLNAFVANYFNTPSEQPDTGTPEITNSMDLRKIIQGLDIKNLHNELQPQKMLVNIEVTK